MTVTEKDTGLWSARHRATTVGIVMVITAAAFEQLGVSTAMPRMLADLHGTALYSWPFTASLAASVIATVLSGRVCDRFGPGPSMLVGPVVFFAGLVVAGSATGMPVLLTGRALQGLGLGTVIVAIYVLVALVYPESHRPKVFGLISAAWVVPSLIGPTVAGLVTEHLSWRWVFLGLTPVALLGLLLLVPAVRGLPAHDATPPARPGLPLAAIAAAFGLTALTWAVQHPSLGTLWLGLGGAAALVPALRTLLPRGTLTARPGLPGTILARGLFAGAFFGVEAYVPLTLVNVHGFSPALAGLPLTISSLGWAASSHWQGRHPDISRTRLIRVAYLTLAGALAAMTLIAPVWGPPWLAAVIWSVAGASMGLAFSSISVLVLQYAAPEDRGFAAAALQVCDQFFAAVTVGIGGVLLATVASAAHPTAAVVVQDLLLAGVALLGAAVFRPVTAGK